MSTKIRKFSKEEKQDFIEQHVQQRSELMAALSSVGEPLPDLTEQARSLLKAGINWAQKGFALVTEDQLKDRLAACTSCNLWDPEGFKGTGRCQKCGCSTQIKLRMATEKCPIGKW